jgi:Tol biopolymer transport system component
MPLITPSLTLTALVRGFEKIAFYSIRDGNDKIYVMNADGSNPRRLTTSDMGDNNPVWSP